jgi:hypothetical protein
LKTCYQHIARIAAATATGVIWAALIVIAPLQLSAQEINFGSFYNYTIELEEVTLGDLEFEGPITSNSGVHVVELIDSKVLSILGVRYLDVDLEISGDGKLFLDGDPGNGDDPQRHIPFTLKAAFANSAENNVTNAIPIAVATTENTNLGTTRFPILSRQQRPPGPPPTPPAGDFDQNLVNEMAYLYLYGEIDVGNVVAGTYRGTITIHVEYR